MPAGIVMLALASMTTGKIYAQESGIKKGRQQAVVKGAGDSTQKADTARVLREVTVRARPPLIRREIDRTVINVEASISSAGSNVLELMRKLPGVQVDPDGQISLNGKGGVTVYLDGKASYLSPEDLAQLLQSMSAADIRQIELMPNPSAKYDAAGTGGVINIVRKKNRGDGWNGSLRGGGGLGRYDKYNGGGEISYRDGPCNVNLNSSYSMNEVLTGLAYGTDFLAGDHAVKGRQQGATWDLNRTQGNTTTLMADYNLSGRTVLSFSGTGTFQFSVTRTSSLQNIWDSAGVPSGGLGFTDLNKSHTANYNGGLRLVHTIDTSGGEWSLDLDYATYPNRPRQWIENSRYDADGALAGDSATLLDRTRSLHIYAAKMDYSRPLPGKARLDMGWKLSYVQTGNEQHYHSAGGGPDTADPSGDSREQTAENINALYLNVNKELKNVRLQAGLRAEQTWNKGETWLDGGWQGLVKKNYWQLFPSLFGEYSIGSRDRVSFQMGSRVLRPSYRFLNPLRDPISATSYYQGDPGLKPQVNTTVELGYSRGNDLTVTLGGICYRRFFKAFSFPDSNGLTTTRMPANISKGWGIYLQVTGSRKLRPWWQVNYNMNLYDRWFEGLIRGVTPQVKAVLTMNLETNQDFMITEGWSADLGFKYVTGRQVVSGYYGPYSNLSCGIRRVLLSGIGTITLSVYNLMEKEGNSFAESTSNIRQDGYSSYYSRSLNLNVSYRFGGSQRAATRRARGDAEEQQRTGN